MVRPVPAGLPSRSRLAASVTTRRLSRTTANLASATPKRGPRLRYLVVAMRDVRLTELQGIHVLVIDDDLHARHYLRSVLELWGAIVTATSASDAIRVALIADVIVCDLTSAENANGEFLERLRHMHVRQGRRVPAIALVARRPAGCPRARPGLSALPGEAGRRRRASRDGRRPRPRVTWPRAEPGERTVVMWGQGQRSDPVRRPVRPASSRSTCCGASRSPAWCWSTTRAPGPPSLLHFATRPGTAGPPPTWSSRSSCSSSASRCPSPSVPGSSGPDAPARWRAWCGARRSSSRSGSSCKACRPSSGRRCESRGCSSASPCAISRRVSCSC